MPTERTRRRRRDAERGADGEVADAGAGGDVSEGLDSVSPDGVDQEWAAVVAAARNRTVTESMKERAMDEAPVGITITDPSLPDNPLVYVNEEFERMTGYSREETVGRNCRFLQGEGTREEPVAKMRQAVAARERTSVELRNYRKDGQMFWNRVDVAPVFEDGEVAYFVGFQTDVTRRKLAETAARERARALRDVVSRVDGLLSDVSAALVRATDRNRLQSDVCRQVAATEPYALAWIGEYDWAAETVDVAVAYGADGEPAPAADLDLTFAPDDPVQRAVETGEIQVVADATERPGGRLHGPEWPDRFGSMAAIPLAYRDVTYGVLCVYARERRAFDDHETVVLASIGRTVATAINAVESHRRVATDEVAQVRLDLAETDLFPVAIAERLDCRVGFVGADRSDDGSLTLLFDVAGAAADEVAAAASALDGVDRVTPIVDHGEGCLVAFTGPDVDLVAELAERSVTVEAFDADESGAHLLLSVPERTDARAVVGAVREYAPAASVTAYRNRERVPTTRREVLATVEEELTDRQRTALTRAHAAGYFERPRQITGEALAASMDLSTSTFNEHLRAALSTVVSEVTDGAGMGDPPT